MKVQQPARVVVLSFLGLCCFFFALVPAVQAEGTVPDDLWLERSAIYHGEEDNLVVDVSLTSRDYAYLFLETPDGRFLDRQGREYRDPAVYDVFGPGRDVECLIDPELFGSNDTGVYTLYAVQYGSRHMDSEDLGVETRGDLNDRSLQESLDVVGHYSTAASTFSLDREETRIGRSIELTVTFRDTSSRRMRGVPPHERGGGQELYLDSSRDAEELVLEARAWNNGWVDVTAEVSGVELADGINIFDLDWEDSRGRSYETIYTRDSGRIYMELTTRLPGELDIRVARDSDFGSLLRNGEQTLSFYERDAEEVFLELERDVSRAGERFELIATVMDGHLEAEDVEVVFQERRDEGSWRTIGRSDTGRRGEARWEIYRDEAETYEYRVEALGQESDTVEKEIVAAAPFELEAAKSRVYALTGFETKVRFDCLDRYGNNLEEKTLEYTGQDPLDIIEVKLFDPDGEEVDADRYLGVDADSLYLEYDFPDEGTYQVEAYIAGTGISAECEVRAEEFGAGEELEFEADKEHIRARERALSEVYQMIEDGEEDELYETTKLSLILYDDQGNSIELDADDVSFSMDRRDLATVYEDDEGQAWLIADRRVSGELEITAYHDDSDLNERLTITIAGEPWEIDAEVEIDGLRATVILTYLDGDGEHAAVMDEEEAGYHVITPDGLESFAHDDFEVGRARASFQLEALEEKEYELRVITDVGISTTLEVNFGEEPEEKQDEEEPAEREAAKKVTMYIDSTTYVIDDQEATMDLAPFIQEGRTYVPVRFITEAFGGEADYEPRDSRVEKVFLSFEDLEIKLEIDSTKITVIEKGEEQEVASDAAPEIHAGRTVLPFRVIAEQMGAEVDYGPRDAEVEWVSFAR